MFKRGLRPARAGALAIALLAAVGCGQGAGDSAEPARVPEADAISAAVAAESPANVSVGNERPPLMERLRAELGDREGPAEDFAEWLTAFGERDNPGELPVKVERADLDGDGADEWVAVLYESVKDEKSGEERERNAYAVVISFPDGRYELQSFAFPEEYYGRASVEAIADLTGDGNPEIVWSALGIGAHTTTKSHTVSSWTNGKLNNFEGSADVASVTAFDIEGGRLRIVGGLIHSVGAGNWQREFTDTYAVIEGALVRTDRVFAESPTSYHRLIDGLWAERYGRAEQALLDFEAARTMSGVSYEDYAFIFGGEWVESGSMAEEEKKFERAVESFAMLRGELLTRTSSGEAAETACEAAKKKAGYSSDWLPYLNAPAGYANPVWNDGNVCSPIDEVADLH
ncbi:hypothetical protein ACF3MZ_28860 [Paenibacillaceae bacterium WGS1546]|uniref:hypothetical protein n=1 Tax=Cohnella sp. WGS1546 TaxID=3366810 RepID=UPI00372D3398